MKNRVANTIPVYVLLVIFAALTLLPFSYMVVTSFKDREGNAAGMYVPRLPDRGLKVAAADINIEDDTIKVKSELRTADVVRYSAYVEPQTPAIPAAAGAQTVAAETKPVIKTPAGGLTDGQTYYAMPMSSSVIKLAATPQEAEQKMAAYRARLAEIDASKADRATRDAQKAQAAKDVKGIDLTSPGGDFQLLFNPAHVLWDSFTFDNYVKLFRDNPEIKHQIANSFFFASVTSLFATLFCAMGGYALAMFHFQGRKVLTAIVLSALIIPATMLTAPNYQLIFRMGLLDTFAGLILPAIGPAFLVFLFRQALISGMPQELLEAGRIDGCGEIRMFFQIALPLIRPMVSASLLITFIGSWNNFINPQVILQSPQNFTLSVAVAQLQDIYSFEYGTLMAGTVISVLPVMVLFLLLQKEFIAGLTAGAVKG